VPPTDDDRAHVTAALAAARSHRSDLDDELLQLLRRILLAEEEGPLETALAMRFQQLSAPVMAKGVEDTAFYRYQRLVALNEVGGDPGTFGSPVEAFHAHCAHLASAWPDTMLTLSTHDTKRSADVRARIALLSELPDAWAAATARWADHNQRHRRRGVAPDRAMEALLYQTLVGAWPIEPDRVVATMAKSAREAKVHTSWAAPDRGYDDALVTFTEGVLADPWFVGELEAFLEAHRIVELGRATSLSQVALLATGPGVPDVYQGTELWDLSLVDPDNRRPVDHRCRADLLQGLLSATAKDALRHLDDGGAKLWLLSRLLRDRRRSPERYAGREHVGLVASGQKARHVVASHRGPLVVIVPRLLVGLAGGWGDTTVTLPGGAWQDVLTGALRSGGPQRVADLVEDFPVAVLAVDALGRG
jgi:(1->4)-alpha-D-glucan 1-alpha-D-glucosylmutase